MGLVCSKDAKVKHPTLNVESLPSTSKNTGERKKTDRRQKVSMDYFSSDDEISKVEDSGDEHDWFDRYNTNVSHMDNFSNLTLNQRKASRAILLEDKGSNGYQESSSQVTDALRVEPPEEVIMSEVSSTAAEPGSSQTATEAMVCEFIEMNPNFLESFVMENIELETLERWMIRRMQKANGKVQNEDNVSSDEPEPPEKEERQQPSKMTRKTSLSRWKFCVHADKRKMLQELTHTLHAQPNKASILWELSQCISSAVNADGIYLYLVDPVKNKLHNYKSISPESESNWSTEIQEGSYLCAWVASTRQPIRISGNETDPRFPKGCPFKSNESHHLLTMSVTQSNGDLVAILELYRKESNDAFHEEDEEIVNSYLVWGGIALHYAELYHDMTKQRKLNDFMLSVVKSIFQDMVSMDTLIMKVMNFAQRLVSADRASLFLVDNKTRQMYARIFDIGSSDQGDSDSTPQVSKEIRFPIGTGIAGTVAQTGEVMNILDAYSDPRFNRNVDQLTGYVTKSILCMPIFIRSNVIGVMQMVNKDTGIFTREDEESFEMFAVYCGLALHHAKLYDKIRRSEQKYKVALEIMSYHANYAVDEFSILNHEEIPEEIPAINSFSINPLVFDELDKVRHTIYMFVDLFGLARFEKDCLIKFCLTVKKNYRRVPYHNWTHGFSVANSMYAIIKHAPKAFKPLECLALFIGALCHDLDHRGKNNKFLLDTDSPLAAIYTTSTLEHHHFNQTVTILQQEGHNIFNKLTSSEYKQVLGNVKHCILATDLALFFPNKAKLTKLVEDDEFSWNDPEHRLILEAVTMTACDLCASSKPWEVQQETVKVIFEEFYEQGDAERACGRDPIPMMDRTKPEEQPASQIGFLSGICIPCYELIAKLVPPSIPLLEGCKKNYERWQQMSNEAKRKKQEEEELSQKQQESNENKPDGADAETTDETKIIEKENDIEANKQQTETSETIDETIESENKVTKPETSETMEDDTENKEAKTKTETSGSIDDAAESENKETKQETNTETSDTMDTAEEPEDKEIKPKTKTETNDTIDNATHPENNENKVKTKSETINDVAEPECKQTKPKPNIKVRESLDDVAQSENKQTKPKTKTNVRETINNAAESQNKQTKPKTKIGTSEVVDDAAEEIRQVKKKETVAKTSKKNTKPRLPNVSSGTVKVQQTDQNIPPKIVHETEQDLTVKSDKKGKKLLKDVGKTKETKRATKKEA